MQCSETHIQENQLIIVMCGRDASNSNQLKSHSQAFFLFECKNNNKNGSIHKQTQKAS